MITSTPIKRSLQRSRLQIEEIVPDIKDESTLLDERTSSSFDKLYSSDSRDSWRSTLTRSQLMHEEIAPEAKARDRLRRSPLQLESIPPTSPKLVRDARKFRDVGTNTRNKLKGLAYSQFVIDRRHRAGSEEGGQEANLGNCD